MKTITEQHYNSIVEAIIKEKEKQAESANLPFIGMTPDELRHEVNCYLGTNEWLVKRNPPKFDRKDISAVASARFFRKTGISLFMGVIIAILVLSIGIRYVNMTPLYYNLCYTFIGLLALGFIYVYSKMQGKVRRELWRQLGREEIDLNKPEKDTKKAKAVKEA